MCKFRDKFHLIPAAYNCFLLRIMILCTNISLPWDTKCRLGNALGETSCGGCVDDKLRWMMAQGCQAQPT